MAEKIVRQAYLTGERAMFMTRDAAIYDTVFADGESPLKESCQLLIDGCLFRWKYPLWYCEDVIVKNSSIFEMGRAGIWYTNRISMENTIVEAPKNFRRCDEVTLQNVHFPNASETLWHCKNVHMKQVEARGDYFAMNCENMEIDGLTLVGNYSFDGVKNMTIRNSRLLSKDAFWNTDHVVAENCFISGEYLGWNAKNLTLINCTIESLQGMCYIENLVMKNCKLINTTLAFEYSTVEADITSRVDSVINPTSGTIRAEAIGELIIEPDKVDPGKTTIICREA